MNIDVSMSGRLADTKGQMLCHRYEVPRSKSHVLYFNQSQGYASRKEV